MLVNMQAFEDARRAGQVTEYEVYPRQSSDVDEYQVKAESVPSVFPGDVRILHGRKLIDFWTESKGIVWSKLPKLLTKTPQKLFALIAGIPSSASNGADTFEFFDDFLGSSVNTSKWSVTGNGISVSGSIVTLTTSSTDTQNRLTSLTNWSKNNGTILRARLKTQYLGATNRGEQSFGAYINKFIMANYNHGHSANSSKYSNNDGTEDATNIVGWTADTWKIQELKRPGLTRWTVNDANKVDHSIHYPTDDFPIWIRADYYDNPATMWVDWVLIRKYASTEPLILKKSVLGKAAMIRAVIAG